MAEKRYDTIFSVDYDKKWGKIDKTHKSFLSKFLSFLPEKCKILDAACGTGKYWKLILENNCQVVGIDQSEQMLIKAKEKFPNCETVKIGLQEMCYENEFEGIICIDAMENVFPEDWTLVLKNFYRALKKKGYLYFTVELIDEKKLKEAYIEGKRMGLPIVEGEVVYNGGYHYYPPIKKVKEWLYEVGFKIIEEGLSDGYYHFLVKKL
ncbi:class I SAM-dependent methyltransferase [Thermosipho ferrireducens]|uniref:Class I SAM-dependent methyltransferase n=1 Tax=Thermosipho ferrireducens TaxID=2571116 RepID=A0ABX7S7L9_9BACT|nr:class I SAM-dependent methyltransferase [Thermosipho ferrireducens]QTA37913.1 class I SAM-dependent methyltransferase [Thermosipho ferrireducens]